MVSPLYSTFMVLSRPTDLPALSQNVCHMLSDMINRCPRIRKWKKKYLKIFLLDTLGCITGLMGCWMLSRRYAATEGNRLVKISQVFRLVLTKFFKDILTFLVGMAFSS